MFAGALLMYFAAQQTTFAGFFPLLLAYSLTYMPTIALTNSIAFANVPDVERDFPRIRVMGTIGWIASGLACGFLRIADNGGLFADVLRDLRSCRADRHARWICGEKNQLRKRTWGQA